MVKLHVVENNRGEGPLQRLIQKTPFAQYRVSQNVKEREYLTEDEIKTVMTHEFANRKLAYIRDLFVFASFTALSFWI